jgi:L-alanine-DL-glutamate epimerase-like enolase superfamily enzyme
VLKPEELEAEVDVRDGYVYPLEGPGLGLDIDEDVLGRRAVQTLSF